MFAGWCAETSGQFLRFNPDRKKTFKAIRAHRIVPIFRLVSSTACAWHKRRIAEPEAVMSGDSMRAGSLCRLLRSARGPEPRGHLLDCHEHEPKH